MSMMRSMADLQAWIVFAGLAGLVGMALLPLCLGAFRRLRRQGLFLVLVSAGFLVSMAKKPTPTPEPTPAAGCYDLIFKVPEGSAAVKTLECRTNTVYSLPAYDAKAFTPPSGKRFAGWRGSDGRRYDDGILVFDVAPAGKTVTLTAIWE